MSKLMGYSITPISFGNLYFTCNKLLPNLRLSACERVAPLNLYAWGQNVNLPFKHKP